jgi:hypothetical protein
MENFTFCRVIVFLWRAGCSPGICKFHMRMKKNHIAHLFVLEVQEGRYG